VQMPAGVPVATVSIAGARNAGLLAARVLAAGTDQEAERLRDRLAGFAEDLRAEAEDKARRLRAAVHDKNSEAPGTSAH